MELNPAVSNDRFVDLGADDDCGVSMLKRARFASGAAPGRSFVNILLNSLFGVACFSGVLETIDGQFLSEEFSAADESCSVLADRGRIVIGDE